MKLHISQLKRIIDDEISSLNEASSETATVKTDMKKYEKPIESYLTDTDVEVLKKIEKLPKKPFHMYLDRDVRDSAFRRELADYIKKFKDAGGELSTAGTQNLARLDPENPDPTDDPEEVGLETMELSPEEFAKLMKKESTRDLIRNILYEEIIDSLILDTVE